METAHARGSINSEETIFDVGHWKLADATLFTPLTSPIQLTRRYQDVTYAMTSVPMEYSPRWTAHGQALYSVTSSWTIFTLQTHGTSITGKRTCTRPHCFLWPSKEPYCQAVKYGCQTSAALENDWNAFGHN